MRGHRLIPAHAGKTIPALTVGEIAGAHPRSRGENLQDVIKARVAEGSSPLTRGKLGVYAEAEFTTGLIPAHAGKTRLILSIQNSPPAHPRSRGENRPGTSSGRPSIGSSPLTRGKRPHIRRFVGEERLIPAHAGKTLPDMRFYCADRSDLGNP